MNRSKVYFTDFHATPAETLPQKLHRLMKRAGFETIDFADRCTAVKIHFGELGNLAHLRPQYAKVVTDYVKALGGKVFLTDCNTLYVGSRKNALDHLETAYLNGFSPFQTGCHVIIGDGLKGTDEALVPIDLPYVKEAKIGQAIMDADIVISLNHFKGRPAFHISLIYDVSPFCDCHAENDIPIIPDVGMLASFDPVALDQACVDLCNQMPVCKGSRLDKHRKSFGATDPNQEYFHLNHPDAEWEAGLIHAEEIGLGTRAYELIRIL